MKKSIITALIVVIFIFSFTSCNVSNGVENAPTLDMAGNEISVPEKIERILSLSPASTQILQSMGYSDLIVGIDSYSEGYLLSDIENVMIFDMQAPDVEKILTLSPDIIFIPGISLVDGMNPYSPLIDAGICVAVIPSAESFEQIKTDINFIAECMGEPQKAASIINKMDADIAAVRAIGDRIEDKKTVMFEIASMPYIYSFGSGTYLNEMIEIIGAENVFAAENSWIAVSEESALAANPDVILTSVNYIDDPVGEILSRTGWEAVTAVKTKSVYKFKTDQTDIPNQFVIEALYEMAKFVYPDEYEKLEYTEVIS
jgi:iron complex transport system substrate-binding protein